VTWTKEMCLDLIAEWVDFLLFISGNRDADVEPVSFCSRCLLSGFAGSLCVMLGRYLEWAHARPGPLFSDPVTTRRCVLQPP
jgi:hypothetical protein